MDEYKRIKKIINWLAFQGVAESDKELSEKLGYTKSSFSQIINGKVPLSAKFVKKLCSLDKNINEVWVLKGTGTMFKDNPNSEDGITIPAVAWDVIRKQANSLSARDNQIDELIGMLKDQINEYKKAVARPGGNVNSAAAV